jgi:hypothetical protein
MIKRCLMIKSLLATGLIGIIAGSAPRVFAQTGPKHVFPMKPSGTAAPKASSGTLPLADHGGPVMSNATAYAIYWGKQSTFPTDLKTALPLFFEGFGPSEYSYILDQYLPAVFAASFDSTTASDSTSPPTTSPATSKIVNEACKYIKAKTFPLTPVDASTSSGAVYFVYTSNFPHGINFCGWHSYGSCNGQTIAVAYIPNLSGQSGCNPGNLYNANSYSEGTRADLNVAAHEFSEAATDPELNAWYDSSGYEIGDKCAWVFSGPVTLANGTVWQLQEEWSNALNGCAQTQATP